MSNETLQHDQCVLSTMRHDHFQDHVGSPFQVRVSDDTTCTMTLVEVKLGKVRARRKFSMPDGTSMETREQPFTLFLEGDHGAPIEQNSYPVTHAILGSGTLFITPHGRKKAVGAKYPDHHDHSMNVIYQAVFS
ncbi:MAG: hypothetical protein HQL07_03695 [Nitrospirae bacterium]|nr:hypothetical protein [Magnetococcales bacterium]HAT50964.1 hypothetical protein [Alphaproteobacteria bacterium]